MNTLKAIFLMGMLGVCLVVGVAVFAAVVAVAPHTQLSAISQAPAHPLEVSALRLDFGKQLSASNCDGVGSPIINAAQKIQNDADSGQAGNYWGYDTISRTIQVWKTKTAGQYCASVKYQGNFQATEGQRSPGSTGVLTGKESGPLQGGYTALITGTLLDTPLWNTKGGVGTTDYQCDLTGSCPGAINWVTQYFQSSYTFEYTWWGWIYRAGGNKTWVNAVDGNSGDIL